MDVGNLVANPQAGARYGMSMTVYIVLATGAVMVYSEMAGRITAVTGQAGVQYMTSGLSRWALRSNVIATVLLTVAMAGAEVGGVATVLTDAVGGSYRLWVLLASAGLVAALLEMRFSMVEQTVGLLGLAMLVAVVVLVASRPDWATLARQAAHPWPAPTGTTTQYLNSLIAQIGSIAIPYQLIFFSSGVSEEGWHADKLRLNRWNVLLGYGLGLVLVLALMADAAVLYHPNGAPVQTLDQVARMATLSGLGVWGLLLMYLGMFATTAGAAIETALSVGYVTAQDRGWRWGMNLLPRTAPRFYLTTSLGVVAACAIMLTGLSPIELTNDTLILSAVALPITYLATWRQARHTASAGDHRNGRLLNAIAATYFVAVTAVAVAAIPVWLLAKLR